MAFSAEYLAENRGPTIVIINGIVIGFAAIVAIVRAVSRFLIFKRLGWDDWSILVASTFAVGNVVMASQSVRLGTGRHIQAVPKRNTIPNGIWRFGTRIGYFCITGSIKLSVCFLYLHIFPNIRKSTLILLGVICCATISQVFSTIFQCVPVAAVWNPKKYPHAFCINNVAFSYSAGVISVLTDVWALVLPISTVWSLRMARRKKLTLLGLFSLGIFACIAGIIRMVFLITLLTSTDPTWDTFGTSVASGWEVSLAIITACIPGLKPLFDKIFPKIFPSTKVRTTDYAAESVELETGAGSRAPKGKGFVELGGKDNEDDDSTKAIKVNYEYEVHYSS